MYQDYGAAAARRARGARGLPRHRQRAAASPPAGSPTPSAWRARRSPSTPPARPRWSPCTWPRRRCAAASARWRWPAASTVMADPGHVRRVQPAARPGRRRPLQGVRGRRRRHRLGRGRRRAAAGAAVRRPPQRPPGPRGGPRLARSTRTARRNGLTAPNGPSQQRVIRAGAGQRRADARPTSTRSRRTAPAPRSATRSRRRRCSPPTARTGRRTGRCGSAR